MRSEWRKIWQASCSDLNVVNQPRAPDARGDEQPQGTIGLALDLAERRGVARFEIIELEAGLLDLGATLVEHARDAITARDGGSALLEHAIECRRRGAFRRRQIGIA